MIRVKSFGSFDFDSDDYLAAPADGVRISLPNVRIKTSTRIGAHPTIAGVDRKARRLPLIIFIRGEDEESLRSSLLSALDPTGEDSKQLTIDGDDKGARYVLAVCEELVPVREGGKVIPRLYSARMVVDKDVRWRAASATEESTWGVGSSGDTTAVDNGGDCDAYPVITVTPTSAKDSGSGFEYKRWCPIIWKADVGYNSYPVMLGTVDTDALVTASKAQSGGEDWRVYVDGEEVDRWFGGSGTAAFNQTATKTWVNLDLEGEESTTLGGALDGSSSYDEIEAGGDINGFPASGILLIEDEAFVYTGKSNVEQKFTGVTRAAKGTSMASHAAGMTIYWVQHDVWIFYGDASLSAPSTDDDYKPITNLADSDNGSWVYEEFGEDDGLRPAAWTAAMSGASEYTGDQGDGADPWTELGIKCPAGKSGRWSLYHPAGITDAHFESGEKRSSNPALSDAWSGQIESSLDGEAWVDEHELSSPTGSMGASETGDEDNQLGGGGGVEGVESDLKLYAEIADEDGGTTFHVNLYDASAKIVEWHDTDDQLSGYRQITGLNDGNTAGEGGGEHRLYAQIVGQGGGDYRVYLYKDARLAGEVYQSDRVSGWEYITGINSNNTGGSWTRPSWGNGSLFARVTAEGGGNYSIQLYNGYAASGDFGTLVGHTAVYSSTGDKSIIADNDSGLGGHITVDELGWTVLVEVWYGWRVARTGDYSGAGTEALSEVFASGIGGSIEIDGAVGEKVSPDEAICIRLHNLVAQSESYTGSGDVALNSRFNSGIGGQLTIDSVVGEDTDIEVTLATTWESWSRDESLTSGAMYVALYLEGGGTTHYVEASKVTVTLGADVPDVSADSEQSNYRLDATIENETTGESIDLDFGMELNESLEINTDKRVVTYLKDGGREQQAITLNEVRRHWLRLQPGSNTVKFTESGLNGVDVDIEYRERYRS